MRLYPLVLLCCLGGAHPALAEEYRGIDALPPAMTTAPLFIPRAGSGSAHSPPTPSTEQQVVELVNLERANDGKAPLKLMDLLNTAAGQHSANMADRDFVAHCDPDTSSLPDDRMRDAGYFPNRSGENIAAGYGSPAAVMNGWMNSSGHRSNILSSNYREIGIGHFEAASDSGNIREDQNINCVPDSFNNGPYFHYWTQKFGRRNNTFPVIINNEAFAATQQSVQLYVYGSGWAAEMRFRNDSGGWSAWETFQNTKSWQLSSGDGSKTVHAEIRNSAQQVLAQQDSILLTLLCASVDELILSDQALAASEVFTACTLITAGPDLQILPSAEVTLQAPRIVMTPGFTVQAGGRLQIVSQVPSGG